MDRRIGGSILMIALWSLCLLSTFAVILGYNVRQKLALVKRLDEKDALRLIAEAGVRKAAVLLKKESVKSYDSLGDGWSNNPAEFKDVEIGAGRFSVGYDLLDERSQAIDARYGLVDEERKVNINSAPPDVLERLFKAALGLDEIGAQELAASIVDWRDNDSELSIPLGSAEDSYYGSLRYPYEAKDADFELLDELLLVKGMTVEIFEKIKDYVTPYGSGRININTAQKPVLIALGLGTDITEKILLFRSGNDESGRPREGGVFEDGASIVPKISQIYPLSPSDLTRVSAVAEQYLTTRSDNFTAMSISRLHNRKNELGISATFDRNGKILYWNES